MELQPVQRGQIGAEVRGDPVEEVVHDARQGGDHQRNGVAQHFPEQFSVQPHRQTEEVGEKQDGANHAAHEDREDRVRKIRRGRDEALEEGNRMLREDQKQIQVGDGFGQNFYRFDDGELQGLVLLAQPGEQNRREGVQHQDPADIENYVFVPGIAEAGGDRADEQN